MILMTEFYEIFALIFDSIKFYAMPLTAELIVIMAGAVWRCRRRCRMPRSQTS